LGKSTISLADDYSVHTLMDRFFGSYSVGFLTGFVFSSIMMSIVGSAVNTVIVCYAEAPNEFHNNHPFLSNEMRVAWRSAWPDVCGSL